MVLLDYIMFLFFISEFYPADYAIVAGILSH